MGSIPQLEQPNIAGNFLSQYAAAQQRQQQQQALDQKAQQDAITQQRATTQWDQSQTDRALGILGPLVASAKPGDQAGWDQVIGTASKLGVDPTKLAQFKDVATLPQVQQLFAASAPGRAMTNEGRQQQQAAETARHNRATETVALTNAAGTQEGELPAETLRFMAGQGLTGDKSIFTNLGRGKQGAKNVVALRNEMVRQATEPKWGPQADRPMTPQELAARMGEFSGFVTGQSAIARRAAAADMAVNEAMKVGTIARQTSSLVPRGQWMPVNRVIQMWQANTGDPNIRKFGAAINSFVNVYSRAINPQGVGTESDKQHARDMLSTADSQEQFNGIMDVLDQEMAAAKASTGVARQELTDTMTGAGGTPPQAPAAPPSSDGWTVKRVK